MRWLAALLLALLCWQGAAEAQSPVLPGFPPGVFQNRAAIDAAPAASYTGPGDIVSGATAWYGLRAYNAAYATGSNNAANLRRASDNTSQNVVILSNGKFDISTANTFAGTDATCTGTIASTTLTCASASSTPHAGSTLTGAGIIQPSYIVSCGTFTGGAGTCTLNAAQTVSVGETITMQYGLYVTEAYDQTGNGNNATENTGANQAQLLPNCGSSFNSLPCFSFQGSQSLLATITAVNQSLTFMAVAERNGLFTTQANMIAGYTAGNQAQVYWAPSTNTVGVYAGTAVTKTASDSASHVFIALFNGASSEFNIDGVDNSVSPGTTGTGTTISIGELSVMTQPPDMLFAEGGLWPSGFSSGNRTAECHNAYAYWGTSVSC